MIKTAVLSHLYILLTFLKIYNLFSIHREDNTNLLMLWFFISCEYNWYQARVSPRFYFFMKKIIKLREIIKTELIILSWKEFTFLMESGSSSCDRVPYPPLPNSEVFN